MVELESLKFGIRILEFSILEVLKNPLTFSALRILLSFFYIRMPLILFCKQVISITTKQHTSLIKENELFYFTNFYVNLKNVSINSYFIVMLYRYLGKPMHYKYNLTLSISHS